MPPPPPIHDVARFYVRYRGGTVVGPHEVSAIAAMLSAGKLNGSEEVSSDRKVWKSVRSLAEASGKATGTRPPPPPAAAAVRAPTARTAWKDDDGISLPTLEIGFGSDATPAPGTRVGAGTERSPTGGPVAANGSGGANGGFDIGTGDDVDLSAPLELEERKPAPQSAVPHPRADPAAPKHQIGVGAAIDRSRGDLRGGVIGTPATSEASAAMSALLEGEFDPVAEATQPIILEEKRAIPDARARRRTMTASRGPAAATVPKRWPPRRAVVGVGVSALLLATAAVAIFVLDVPGRLRSEPSPASLLGEVGAQIAQDRFPAYAEGARRLDESATGRRAAANTRAAAAELLAASVVIHGGERGRITRAEALLAMDARANAAAAAGRTRAEAWIALAKGRWMEAQRLSADPGLSEADRATLAGWAALGRDDAGRAARLFATAIAAEPPPAPSRVAARYGEARSQEALLSPTSEAAYRAVAAEAPDHVGAALGLVRVSKLAAAGRLKLAEAVITKQASEASRAELAEAHAQVSRAARELGDAAKADAALKRARAADPAGAAAAVAAGDGLLADGRTDEAISQFKAALTPPISAPRTPSLKFARVAALLESTRPAEASVALAELARLLPDDARVPFWRGWAAERERPPNTTAAAAAYRIAVARDPHFLPASLQLARLLLEQRHGREALAVLHAAETRGAPATPLRLALGQAQLASGNADEAAHTFRQLLAADPKHTEAHLGLAGALELQGNREAARAELAALAARHDVPGLGSRIAPILIRLGRREEALAAYQTSIAAGDASAGTKAAAARVAIDLGRKDVARTLAQSAVDDDPRTPGSLLVLAEVWRLEGDLPRALLELRRALAVDGSAEVQLEYGRALAALGRDEEALSALAQARDIPESAIDRGRILLRRGDSEGAITELAAASARLPGQADAFLLLGQAEDRLGHAERAEAAWRTAVKAAPQSAEARYRLARLEMDRGHVGAALPNLRAAAQVLANGQRPADTAWKTDLYFQLGFAEARQGSRERARAALRRYLELAPVDAPARAEVLRQVQMLSP